MKPKHFWVNLAYKGTKVCGICKHYGFMRGACYHPDHVFGMQAPILNCGCDDWDGGNTQVRGSSNVDMPKFDSLGMLVREE